jgi:hypothetical protein
MSLTVGFATVWGVAPAPHSISHNYASYPHVIFSPHPQDDDEGDEGESKEDKAAAEAAAAEAKDKAAAEEGEKESKPELEEGEVPPTPPTAKQVGVLATCVGWLRRL